MALSAFRLKTLTGFFATLILMSACLLPSAKADVRAVNQCRYALTIFSQSETTALNQVTLDAGDTVQLDLPKSWLGGIIWGSQHANTDNGQCTQLNFDINGSSDDPGRDFYGIDIVNAYNEAVQIKPTYLANGDVSAGLECGSVICSIANLTSVCQLDNYYAGPDHACINADGPGTIDTPSIGLFENACPEAYTAFDEPDTEVTYACDTGSNYDAIWCP